MKMKTLAVAVAALACGSQAFAAEVYNSDGTSMSIGGHFTTDIGDNGENVEVGEVSPRINIVGKQDLGNGLTVEAKGEWQTNLVEGGDTTFSTRLGYLALHSEMGKVTVGTQWSPYYSVASLTDMPIKYANDFLYDGGRSGSWRSIGTGRANKMLSYSNNFDFGNDMSLYFGVGWQGETNAGGSQFDDRGQIAASLSFSGFNVGLAYTGGDVDSEKLTSTAIAASYGSYGKGIYVAGVYGLNENLYGMTDSDQISGLLAYGLDNGLNFILYYENVDRDDNVLDPNRDVLAPQVEYSVTSKLKTFAGFRTHMGDDKSDDEWSLGARYYF
ncbi:hypothetical protein BTN99_02220 [Vibrio campbellii]|nr:hypothetical protein BTN99_02220 [Vibrio campbellii]